MVLVWIVFMSMAMIYASRDANGWTNPKNMLLQSQMSLVQVTIYHTYNIKSQETRGYYFNNI